MVGQSSLGSFVRRPLLISGLVGLLILVSMRPAWAAAPTGYLDLATADRLAGWAYDPDFANSTDVHVYVDGTFYKAVTANKFRGDLTFWHGGYIAFDMPIFAGCGQHSVVVYAIGRTAGGGFDGQNIGIGVTTVMRSCPAGGAPSGWVDVANSQWLAGWAVDPNYAGPVNVNVYVDGAFYTSIRADGFRADVGAHAFDYREGFIPNPAPGQPSWIPHAGLALGKGAHRVELYAVGVDGAGNPDGGYTLIGSGPQTISGDVNDYLVLSPDESIRITVSARFGGAITKIHDSQQPQRNLVDGDQAGAMFQNAFWVLPYRNPSPGCPDRPDFRYDNPTQAGYVADGWQGNPIGTLGINAGSDPAEFIRYENDNRTVHLKSRFIRYDFCSGVPDASNRQNWDTDFYVEQWVSIDAAQTRTLKLHSVISYVGPGAYVTSNGQMNSRQLPVLFARDVTSLAYWDGSAIQTGACQSASPASTWAALVAAWQGTHAGLGFVEKPTLSTVNGGPLFACQGNVPGDLQNRPVTVLYTDLPALESIGSTTAARIGYAYQFVSGTTFDWYTFHPIGSVASIKAAADDILAHWASYAVQ